jgi:cell division septation protein DedD
MATLSTRPAEGRIARLIAAIALVALAVAVVLVVRYVGHPGGDTTRGPFDPATTDRSELRRVTEAVSRIIAAPPDQHEASVQTLETVRTESAGARDLKDACVNTYRGMIRAEALQRELGGLAPARDGGGAGAPTDTARAAELLRQARDQIELVEQSKDRCLGLYTAAVQQLGLAPAR